jgi:ATP/maltotriose-dependent transcriptional regulator MalT/DNA-binding SARP family transcriptional activator
MAERTGTRRGGQPSLEVPYPSKVELPVRRPAIVRRQRLIERLSNGTSHRVTLLTVPPGYGKTTLLLDFAQSGELPVAWYTLDERDTDLALFLRYFAVAGTRINPRFADGIAAAFEEPDAITAARATDLMVSASSLIDKEAVFILDDFHFLDDAPEDLRKAIDGWLYRLPPTMHVILASRSHTELSVLPLMAARQEVETVGVGDFAFTCDEVAQLFRDVLGKELALDDAQHLADITEGWAASLVLMADKVEASRTAISLESLRDSDTLFRYMTLEQFDPLPEDVREFLTGSAVLRKLNDKTVDRLLGITNASERLNFLERQNLFVMREGNQEHSHRYHRLYRAFLVSKLRTQDPDRFRDLNLRAAEQMEQAENWEEAVYHFIQVAAWDRIVQIAERVGWRMFEEGKWDTLADWLEAIPADELQTQPRLMLWKARILLHLNQVDRALALLTQTMDTMDENADPAVLAETMVVQGMCLRFKGETAEARQALETACEILKENRGPEKALLEARKELGVTLSICGELTQSIAELRAVLDAYSVLGDTPNIAHTSDQLGVTLGLAGRLAEAVTALEQARQRWMKLGNEDRLLQTLVNLANAYYLQGNNETAETVARQALDNARSAANARMESYLLASLGDIVRQKGEYPAALELYNSVLEDSWALDDAYIRVYTTDAIANTYQLMGDIQSGESWCQRAMAEAEKQGGALEMGICHITEGVLKRQQGDFKDASATLERAIGLLETCDARRELATAHFHLAGTYFSMKRKRLALDNLEKTAEHVQELGYDHFLLVEAVRNPLLVQYASANKLADGYYARVLKLIKGAGTTAPAQVNADAPPEEEIDASTIQAFGLGQPRAQVGGHEVTDLEWRAEKSKEMFFFFLCNRRPLRKDEIVAALWPDLADEKTTSAFHSNMYRLRKALYQDVIAKDSGRYILDPRGKFAFDVEEFQGALKNADEAPKGSPEAIRFMEKALAVYKGQFAPDFYSEWAETLRWQLEEQFMSLLGTLATAYSQQGEFKKAADLSQRIIELDEFNEAAWYRLMSSYIQSGQTEAAKYCYNRYVGIITKEMDDSEGVPEFEEIVREIAGK